jgi:hypothetical protein
MFFGILERPVREGFDVFWLKKFKSLDFEGESESQLSESLPGLL